MYQTIETVYETLDKKRREICKMQDEKESAVRTICKLQSIIEREQHQVTQLESELKTLHELNRKAQGETDGCSLSLGPPTLTRPEGTLETQALKSYSENLKKG